MCSGRGRNRRGYLTSGATRRGPLPGRRVALGPPSGRGRRRFPVYGRPFAVSTDKRGRAARYQSMTNTTGSERAYGRARIFEAALRTGYLETVALYGEKVAAQAIAYWLRSSGDAARTSGKAKHPVRPITRLDVEAYIRRLHVRYQTGDSPTPVEIVPWTTPRSARS